MIVSQQTESPHANPPTLPECVVTAMRARPPRRTRSTALDIGAHHGMFARAVIAELKLDTVFAFEPNAANFAKLCSSSADFSSIVSANAAVGKQDGFASFGCNDDDATGSVLNYVEETRDLSTGRLEVPMIAIDTFCRSFANDGRDVQLIKIDTQGYDLEVLRGSEQTLLEHEPIVLLEFIFSPLYVDQALPWDIESWMRARAYRIVGLTHIHVDDNGLLAFADALFVPTSVTLPHNQHFRQVDSEHSWRQQVVTFERICAERLTVIETLDAEVTRLKNMFEEQTVCRAAAVFKPDIAGK